MINKYLSKNYINNLSDIKSFLKDKEILNILNSLKENNYIEINNTLIHKNQKINEKEQFIFNLDNYITFIKNHIFISPLELRYILNLTIKNNYNKILKSKLYYYENVNLYHKEFKKMFMYNYNKNIHFLNKYTNIKKKTFNELVNTINTHKKRTYCYFEIINHNNMDFYLTIIKHIENIN